MSKDKISDYDGVTAGNNTDIGGISIDEGMLPSAVNNSLRELTKQLGAFADGTDGIDVLNLHDDDASASIKIQAPATVTTTTTLTLPDGAGSSGQVLTTNGSGTLSWSSNGLSNVVEDTTPQLGGNLDTNGNDITFGDNDKAIFGAGSDLQIYHDGSNSTIRDEGTGDLTISTNGAKINLAKSPYENMLVANTDGAVDLYYDNAKKLATTSGGIDVTGSVTADGLTVEAGNSPITLSTGDSGYVKVTHPTRGGDYRLTTNGTASEHFDIQNGTQKLARFSGSGDIAFYDSSGSSQSLFWDASTQRLGLGTTAPSQDLHLKKTGYAVAKIDGTLDTGLDFAENGTDKIQFRYRTVDNRFDIFSSTAGGNVLTIADTSGNVGIGTAPSYKLDVEGTVRIGTGGSVQPILYRSGATGALTIDTTSASAGACLLVNDNGSERMRIDSSGNLLVGATTTTNMSDGTGNDGVALNPAGTLVGARTSNVSLVLNRLSTDGAIANFNFDGTTVGKINVAGGGAVIQNYWDIRSAATTGSGLGGNDGYLQPLSKTGASDGGIDLGASGSRFKDLYLSGGVYLGGTGSANKLDDYEEGSFSGTIDGSSYSGSYTKVGRIVHISMTITNTTATGNRLASLPFSSKNGGTAFNGVQATKNTRYALTDMYFAPYNGGTTVYAYSSNGGTQGTVSGGEVELNFTYETD